MAILALTESPVIPSFTNSGQVLSEVAASPAQLDWGFLKPSFLPFEVICSKTDKKKKK